ncbi:hypothetical protein BJ973_001574 [Actinoplanes tereljensis]
MSERNLTILSLLERPPGRTNDCILIEGPA